MLISEKEMTEILTRVLNVVFRVPIADSHDNMITLAAPATGQLFILEVKERK